MAFLIRQRCPKLQREKQSWNRQHCTYIYYPSDRIDDYLKSIFSNEPKWLLLNTIRIVKNPRLTGFFKFFGILGRVWVGKVWRWQWLKWQCPCGANRFIHRLKEREIAHPYEVLPFPANASHRLLAVQIRAGVYSAYCTELYSSLVSNSIDTNWDFLAMPGKALDFFHTGIVPGFSLYLINLAGRQLHGMKSGSAKLRWEAGGGRSAPFCVLMSLKSRVRSTHGRVALPIFYSTYSAHTYYMQVGT